ncbi:MAG: hypothetical protein ACLPWS_11560 [Rhodomicrobium sp.]
MCKLAGIPHEAGRQSFETGMIVRRGMDAKTTADLGGWEDPAMLLRKYVHQEKLDDVAEQVLGAVLTQNWHAHRTLKW